MKKMGFLFASLVALALLLAACGGAAPTPEPVSFTIDMTEYAFSPDTIEAKVGQRVTLHLVNRGQLAHEIMFGRDLMMMNNRPSGYQVDMFEVAGVEPEVTMMADMESAEQEEEEAHTGFMVFLNENGSEATMTFTVTEDMVGEWEMGCFELEGVHYDQGMIGKFIVTP